MKESFDSIFNDAAILDGPQTNGPPSSNGMQLSPPIPKPETAKELEMVMSPLFAVLCPAWRVTPEEVKALAETYGAAMDKYFPSGVSMGVELNALLATAMILGPRFGKPRRFEKESPGQTSDSQKTTTNNAQVETTTDRSAPTESNVSEAMAQSSRGPQ